MSPLPTTPQAQGSCKQTLDGSPVCPSQKHLAQCLGPPHPKGGQSWPLHHLSAFCGSSPGPTCLGLQPAPLGPQDDNPGHGEGSADGSWPLSSSGKGQVTAGWGRWTGRAQGRSRAGAQGGGFALSLRASSSPPLRVLFLGEFPVTPRGQCGFGRGHPGALGLESRRGGAGQSDCALQHGRVAGVGGSGRLQTEGGC